ncbi:MAG: insulinase family protein [Proteobacteria bacterium]|nr:insulinase family protein [Pseudomonadota bacterium]MCP4916453.1 insulinase family protein [Pseudomonadota bacterium]
MSAHAQDLSIPHEQYQLDNGLNVILVEDHSLPQVVVNLWYGVGSKDEVAGRTGFAHLFEHLMFMGTTRLPDSGFDDLMEGYGGWNNAWTSEDATDYYEVGPSSLTSTFLWMEADRMDGLASAMTQEKLDLQREVVKNERRQSYENAPYGAIWLELPSALYPEGHPYAHTVIGSHEDLTAAELSDVIGFFESWYVPNNASLVLAGDIDIDEAKAEIERLFGHLEPVEIGERAAPVAPDKPVKSLVEVTDESIETPLTMFIWHSPGAFEEGDAALDLVSGVLSTGRSSRLYRRLVDGGIAVEVSAGQYSQLHSSLFIVDAKPAEGHTVEEIEAILLEEIELLAAEGPTPEELERVVNAYEMAFIGGLESLHSRASALNRYQYLTGTPDNLAADLARYTSATPEQVQAAAATLTKDRAATFRVHPAEAPAEETN